MASNRGSPGVAGVTIASIEASGVGVFLARLGVALKERTYRPSPLRRVYIPKAGETASTASRPLSIQGSRIAA